jgi:acetylornithine deacetylase/succinyl-diaminopimelate desuccinylase-like protein
MPLNLAERTLELVNIPSPSREEGVLLEHVRHAVSLPLTYGTDEALLFAAPRSGAPLVLLAGHLDTVPAQDNIPGRIDDGCVIGLGASDMKGGLAVMVELANWAEEAAERLAWASCSSSVRSCRPRRARCPGCSRRRRSCSSPTWS